MMDNEAPLSVSANGRIGGLFQLLAIIVAATMFAMMALTFADVIGRYAFAKPVPGAREFIEFIMGTLIFSAFPIISRNNSHITVSLFDNAFRGRVKRWRDMLIVGFSAVAVGFISFRLFDSATDLHESGVWGEHLDIPIFPVVYGMSGLSFVAFAVLVLLWWTHCRLLVIPTDGPPHEPPP